MICKVCGAECRDNVRFCGNCGTPMNAPVVPQTPAEPEKADVRMSTPEPTPVPQPTPVQEPVPQPAPVQDPVPQPAPVQDPVPQPVQQPAAPAYAPYAAEPAYPSYAAPAAPAYSPYAAAPVTPAVPQPPVPPTPPVYTPPKAKKRSKKPLVITLVCLLLAAAIGFGAWYFLLRETPWEAAAEAYFTALSEQDRQEANAHAIAQWEMDEAALRQFAGMKNVTVRKSAKADSALKDDITAELKKMGYSFTAEKAYVVRVEYETEGTSGSVSVDVAVIEYEGVWYVALTLKDVTW